VVHIKVKIFGDVIPYSLLDGYHRFGGTFHFHFKQVRIFSSILKMETTCISETSVPVYQTTRHHIPEHSNLKVA
jgi:hypothetical protein